MNSKLFLVAKREYTRVVRKPTFWITTLALPLFMVIVMLVSGFSAQSAENKLKEEAENSTAILILDEANVVNPQMIVPPYQVATDFNTAQDQVKTDKVNALIHYPQDFAKTKQVTIVTSTDNLLAQGAFNGIAEQLVKQSILTRVGDPTLIELFNSQFNIQVQNYNAEGKNVGLEGLVVPGVAVVIYFVLITFATSYLLLSVSEEKENRMIETVLSILKPRELITGKVIGQLAIVLTQLLLLIGLAVITLFIFRNQVNVDFSKISVTPLQIIAAIFYVFAGFLIMANIMVGVGSAVPNYKDAQGMSSIFIIGSIIPVYLATAIITDPSGSIAMFFSYFPLTAPLILLFRNGMGVLSPLETIISSLLVLVYVWISLVIAFKLFEFGSLEYTNRINFASFLKSLRGK